MLFGNINDFPIVAVAVGRVAGGDWVISEIGWSHRFLFKLIGVS
jgi:hypothetical protein